MALRWCSRRAFASGVHVERGGRDKRYGRGLTNHQIGQTEPYPTFAAPVSRRFGRSSGHRLGVSSANWIRKHLSVLAKMLRSSQGV